MGYIHHSFRDLNTKHFFLTNRLLRLRFRYDQLLKVFYKCFNKNKILFNKYNSFAKTLIKAGITEPEFYGDFIYRIRKITGLRDFPTKFTGLLNKRRKKGL